MARSSQRTKCTIDGTTNTVRDENQEAAIKRVVRPGSGPKVAVTVHIESADARLGIELKEGPKQSLRGESSSKTLVTVKSVTEDAAKLGVNAGMLLLDYPNKMSVV